MGFCQGDRCWPTFSLIWPAELILSQHALFAKRKSANMHPVQSEVSARLVITDINILTVCQKGIILKKLFTSDNIVHSKEVGFCFIFLSLIEKNSSSILKDNWSWIVNKEIKEYTTPYYCHHFWSHHPSLLCCILHFTNPGLGNYRVVIHEKRPVVVLHF